VVSVDILHILCCHSKKKNAFLIILFLFAIAPILLSDYVFSGLFYIKTTWYPRNAGYIRYYGSGFTQSDWQYLATLEPNNSKHMTISGQPYWVLLYYCNGVFVSGFRIQLTYLAFKKPNQIRAGLFHQAFIIFWWLFDWFYFVSYAACQHLIRFADG
jgi:hypothetical protein